MSRLLFVSLPLSGHLDWGGMLASASALARRGHDVAWASGPAVYPAIEQAGLAFLSLTTTGWHSLPPLSADLAPAELQRLRRVRALDAWLHPATVAAAQAELSDLIRQWQPDALLAEPYAAAAALAVEAASLPLILCGRPALPDLDSAPPNLAGQRIAQLCRQAGVAGRNWDAVRGQIRSPLLHLDYFSRGWYADLKAIAPQTRFVGSAGQPARSLQPDDPPPVLITLGSLFNRDPVFFRSAAEAVLLEGGQPWIVTGQPAGDAVPDLDLPAGALVRDWVDFDELLPRVAAAIHHGGVGTTYALLRHGLPQVAVPHAGDQQPQAGRITQAGIGYGIRPADFTLANARWLVRQLLTNDALRLNALTWRSELYSLGGLNRVIKLVEDAL